MDFPKKEIKIVALVQMILFRYNRQLVLLQFIRPVSISNERKRKKCKNNNKLNLKNLDKENYKGMSHATYEYVGIKSRENVDFIKGHHNYIPSLG